MKKCFRSDAMDRNISQFDENPTYPELTVDANVLVPRVIHVYVNIIIRLVGPKYHPCNTPIAQSYRHLLYYIVFAPLNSLYTLTIIADIIDLQMLFVASVGLTLLTTRANLMNKLAGGQ